MKKTSETDLKELERMDDEKKDIVVFVMFEVGLLSVLAGLVVQAAEWLQTVFFVAGFVFLVLALVRRYQLMLKKAEPVVRSFPMSLVAVQSLCFVAYFVLKSNEVAVYIIAGLLMVFHIAAVVAEMCGKRVCGK